MIPKHYARKKRQLRYLSKQLNRYIKQSQSASSQKIEQLITRIQRLAIELSGVFSKRQLRRLMGAAAIFLGLTAPQTVEAQTYIEPVLNPFNITPFGYISFPAFTDLDSDGDLDLLVFKGYNDMTYQTDILYYENIGTPTEPNYEVPLLNPFGLSFAPGEFAFLAMTDLDGDGDDDLMTGKYDGLFTYYENTGTPEAPNFASGIDNPFGLTPTQDIALPAFADIDGDGDQDLFVGAYPNDLVFFKNTGSANNPQFAIPQSNVYGLVPLSEYNIPTLGDIDLDGDLDLLAGDGDDGNLTVYKNAGTDTDPTFALGQVNPFGLTPTGSFAFPVFGDLDNDGDLDLMVSRYYGDLLYYENTELSSTAELHKDFGLTIAPNPAAGFIQLESAERLSRVLIFDVTGQLVLQLQPSDFQITIDLEELPKGMYTLQAFQEDGYFTSRKIQKF